jgi:hypothetical protein
VSDIKYTPGAPTPDALAGCLTVELEPVELDAWHTSIVVTCTPDAREAVEVWAASERAKGVEVEVVVVGESAP